jgi:uncharacterized membrane protein YoaK (UPF0700 family)/uncharacterized membrane protein
MKPPEAERPPPPGRLSPRQRSGLAIALSAVAGSIDAIGYIVLFKVFTANMTGNTVALGMGLVHHDWLLAARRGFAIPMFLIGMLWSRIIAHIGQIRGWRHSASILFGSEAVLLGCFAVLGMILVPSGRLENDTTSLYFLLLGLLSAGMGVQNASLSHFGPLSVRTTHVTGNLATLADQLARFGIWFVDRAKRVGLREALAGATSELSFRETLFLFAVWVSYFAGAVAGAALLISWRLGAVLPAVAALLALVVVDVIDPILAPVATGPSGTSGAFRSHNSRRRGRMAESASRRDAGVIAIARHPIYSMLLPVPVVCFLGVLVTDITYVESDGNLIWLAFSSWLLLAGLLFGAIAAIVLLVDFIRDAAIRTGIGWGHLLLFYAALLVELFSIFIHERDGWTAVVPIGLTLSIIGALLILAAAWLRRPAVEVAR